MNGDEQCVNVSIIEDNSLEGPHGFQVVISDTMPAINIDDSADEVSVIIEDNDCKVLALLMLC